MKLKLILASALTLIILNAPAFAADPEAQWGKMHVQISNQSGANCVSVEPPVLNHGKYAGSAPPASIQLEDTKTFDMDQWFFYGPSVTLYYKCGPGRIHFEINKPISWFLGTEPYTVTLYADGLMIDPRSQSSSALYNTEAQIVVTIKKVGESSYM